MEYFELFQSDGVVRAITTLNLDKRDYSYQMNRNQFDLLSSLKVGYYSGLPEEEPCDILKEPTFMVSDTIHKLFELYEQEIVWRAVQLFPLDETCKNLPLYWVPFFPILDCLDTATKKYTTGTVEKVVLNAKKCNGRNIFRIGGLLEYKVVISLPVAESLLRRRLYGIGLKLIEVK